MTNHLILNDIDFTNYREAVVNVAKNYGTPTFLFDRNCFIDRINKFKAYAKQAFMDNGISYDIQYAAKAFICKDVAKLIYDNGLNIDTCSMLEMMTAIEAGVSGSSLGLHGNNKSDNELEYAVINDVNRIFVDNIAELVRLQTIAKKFNKQINVFLRVITGVHAGGHAFISTGHEDQKFGLNFKAVRECIKTMQNYPNLHLRGLHSHIGSQIWDSGAFTENLQILLKFVSDIRQEFNIELNELNLGGGFGVQYTPDDDQIDLLTLFTKLAELIKSSNSDIRLSFEPGRWLIAPAMQTVYSVGVIKDIEYEAGKTRRYISVDGGMSDNIRPALYDAKYICYTISSSNGLATARRGIIGGPESGLADHCDSGCDLDNVGDEHDRRAVSSDNNTKITKVKHTESHEHQGIKRVIASVLSGLSANSQNNTEYINCRVVGKHCESGDILIKDILLPSNVKTGDLLIIPCTGAYGYSMASNYNGLPKPAVITLTNGDELGCNEASDAQIGKTGEVLSGAQPAPHFEVLIPRQEVKDIIV